MCRTCNKTKRRRASKAKVAGVDEQLILFIISIGGGYALAMTIAAIMNTVRPTRGQTIREMMGVDGLIADLGVAGAGGLLMAKPELLDFLPPAIVTALGTGMVAYGGQNVVTQYVATPVLNALKLTPVTPISIGSIGSQTSMYIDQYGGVAGMGKIGAANTIYDNQSV